MSCLRQLSAKENFFSLISARFPTEQITQTVYLSKLKLNIINRLIVRPVNYTILFAEIRTENLFCKSRNLTFQLPTYKLSMLENVQLYFKKISNLRNFDFSNYVSRNYFIFATVLNSMLE
jgi:hypothetical protein